MCQCCKQNFNSQSNIPYLLKCGHFFCKVCILKKFYDENNKMILCPEDGVVAKSLSELKLLKNLIIESNDKSESKSIDEKDERNEIDNLNVIYYFHFSFVKLIQIKLYLIILRILMN